MASLVGLAVGLGLVFACLMFALAAEFYYLLCCRNRAPKLTDVEKSGHVSRTDGLKLKPAVLNGGASVPAAPSAAAVNSDDSESGSVNSSISISDEDEEIGLDTELMKLHGLAGPPRFLFTIKEESREDLSESEDGRSGVGSRSICRSLSDSELEFGGFPVKSSSSPPPKFKFLRDAEEKFYWKQRVERPAQVTPLPLMEEKLTFSV